MPSPYHFTYHNGSRELALDALAAGKHITLRVYRLHTFLAEGECLVEPGQGPYEALARDEARLLTAAQQRFNTATCPECGQPVGECYALCPTQGLAEWERHHDRYVAPFGDDSAREAFGDADPGDDIFDGTATGYHLTPLGCYPMHPAGLIRSLVIERSAVPSSLREWVELWAYGKPMPHLSDSVVAQVQLDDDLPF